MSGKPRFIYATADSSTINENNAAIVLGSGNNNATNYKCGISFNALAYLRGDENGTHSHHSHAWIGLGPYISRDNSELHPLVFATNSSTTTNAALTERMRILPNGNILIGTANDNGYKLQVNGSANATTLYENGTRVALSGHTHDDRYYTESEINTKLSSKSDTGHTHSYLPLSGGAMSSGARISASDGNLLIGNSSNAGWVGVQDMCSQASLGDGYWSIRTSGVAVFNKVSATNGFFQSSDERLKTFYEPIKPDLEKLKTLRKNYFKFNDKDKLEIGVSAQEVQSIYPEIVSENSDGYLSVAYDKLSVIALAAIDEQQNIINEQNNKIDQLEKRLKAIENILNKLTS